MRRPLQLYRPGLIDYHVALRWQQQNAAAVREGAPEALAVLQHPPVYTLGRRARPENLLVDPATLALRGADVVQTDRGGDVTFHGPGQLVAYPILNLRARNLAPTDYVRLLEEVMLLAVSSFGIAAHRSPGRPGVWLEGAKLGAVGVRIHAGVTTHGLALNVNPDLSFFDAIVPCGLANITVTSLARLLNPAPTLAAVETALLAAFASVFESSFIRDNLPSSTVPLHAVERDASFLEGRGRGQTPRPANLPAPTSTQRPIVEAAGFILQSPSRIQTSHRLQSFSTLWRGTRGSEGEVTHGR